ncbi:MAG: EVE domain-containing protein [Candidatus Magasanikbacteria bacterium]|nr:EVE domain-containing protein [Candidatus Magasanikbacteria bacterium]
MNYWLLKTEPTTFSWDELVRRGRAEWDGVRNYAARNNMRAMAVGDLCFIYHSNGKPEIVGIARVVAAAHQDSTDQTGVWQCVDVEPIEKLARPISLAEIKSNPKLAQMKLVTHSRLSVQPVTEEEWKLVLNATI